MSSRGDAEARVVGEREKIWPLVYAGRLLYFLTLVATAFFFIFPLTDRSKSSWREAERPEMGVGHHQDIERLSAGMGVDLGGRYAQYPITFLVMVFVLSVAAAGQLQDRSFHHRSDDLAVEGSLTHARLAPRTFRPTSRVAGKEPSLAIRSGWRDYLGPALSAIAIVYVGVTLKSFRLYGDRRCRSGLQANRASGVPSGRRNSGSIRCFRAVLSDRLQGRSSGADIMSGQIRTWPSSQRHIRVSRRVRIPAPILRNLFATAVS